MRLVGASNINIKVPFLFEGIFLGLFGSILPVLATIYGYTYLYNYFGGYIQIKTIQLISPTPFIYYVALFLILIAVLVGSLGSLLWYASLIFCPSLDISLKINKVILFNGNNIMIRNFT